MLRDHEDARDVAKDNLDGAILQAIANSGSDQKAAGDAKNLFTKLTSIHAVIGTVKGSARAISGRS